MEALGMAALSAAERAQYAAEGFVIVRGVSECMCVFGCSGG
jgi:hypothetical protein